MNPKGLREDALAGERPWPGGDMSNIHRLLALDIAKGFLVNARPGSHIKIEKGTNGVYKLVKVPIGSPVEIWSSDDK